MATRSPTPHHPYWGVFVNYGDLPNVTGSSTQRAELEAGDQAYVSGAEVFYVCKDATLGAAVWIVSTSSSIRSYGVATVAYANLPVPALDSQMEVSITSNGGNILLWGYFDTWYFRCKVRLRFSDINNITQQYFPYLDVVRTFANRAELVQFVNDNRTSDQVMVEMEVFDVVDGNMPSPANVYGKNRLYAGLLGRVSGGANRPQYWGRQPDAAYYAANSNAYVQLAEALYTLWQGCHPSIAMPDPSVTPWTADEYGCFWFGTNRVRRYDMPRFDGALTVPDAPRATSTVRYVRLVNQNIPDTTTTPRANGAGGLPPSTWGTLSTSPVVYYAALAPNLSATTGWSARDAFKLNAEYIYGNWSVVVGYPLVREIALGQYECSVLVKPIGVDSFFFDAFDDSRYQLEAVGTYRNDGRLMLQSVPISSVTWERRVTNPVLVQSLSAVMRPVRRYIQSGRNGYAPGRARFQYRDLLTGMVSSLSPAGIEPVVRKRARPFALMVRDRPET